MSALLVQCRRANEALQEAVLEDRCGFCSEDGTKQCVYYAGHKEPLHRFGPLEPWPPAYFLAEGFGEAKRREERE